MQYPEISEKVFIINAGWIITTLWAAIKPFIPSRTEEKLTILGTNYHSVLSEELFGTSNLSNEGMTHLESVLSTSPLSSSGEFSHNEIHSVESAYLLIVEQILSSPATTSDSSDSPPQHPADVQEFLQTALNYLEKFPSSRVALQKKYIDTIQLLRASLPDCK
jgi:hypothetical protein